MTGTVVVRLPNWLGDTVMAAPTVASLRAAWPGERIAVAGPWATILAEQDLADVVITYPRAWAGRLRTADTVRALAPALAVLLPNSFEAALAARYWGARRRVGFATSGRATLLTDAVAMPLPRLHQVDEYLVLATRAGGAPVAAEPRLRAPAVDGPRRLEVRRLLADAGAGPGERGRPLVGVHLGAEYGTAKRWPLRRVSELCRLAERDGVATVLLGAPGDADDAAAVQRHAPVPSLVGRDHPALLPALMAELDALVSGDTGVAHLAAALGTPVVALFGPTDPRLSAPRGPATTLSHPVPCAPCFYRTCPVEHACLDGVDGGAVLARVRALLGAAA